MIGKVCGTCGQIDCTRHKRKPWAGSDRRAKTKSGWAQQRRARKILALHRHVCHVCGMGGATEVDHVVALSQGGQDRAENLRPIHSHCHKTKTQTEAQDARRSNDPASLRHP